MDPELMNQTAAQVPPAQSADGDADGGQEDQGDTGPLEKMEVEPAEDGGSIVTHHPKVPPRVKNMESVKPKKHVMKNHEELVEHMKRHGKRLKA